MISNDLLREKILDSAIHGTLVENDLSLPPVDVEVVTEDIPFAIHSNWKWTKLKNIFDVKGGKRIPKGESFSDNGSQVYIRVADMMNMTISLSNLKYIDERVRNMIKNYIITDNDLYITVAGTIGQVGSVPQELNGMNLTENANRLIPKNVDKEYYKYILNGKYMQDVIKDNTTKAAQPKLAIKRINELIVPVPPLEEQKRIVAKIDELFELINQKDNNDKEREKLQDVLKDKILDSAIHGTLVENDLSLPPVDVEVVTEDIPFAIHSNWKWTLFDSISVIVRGGSPRPIKDYLTDSNDGINWIKIGDTNPNEYYINSVKEKIKPEGMHKSRFVEKGSLLLTNSMSFGRPYILNVDGCIHDGWLNIKDRDNYFDNMYMVYLLSSKYFYNVMCDKSSGAVVSNLNIDKVKSLKIPLPPLEEQKKIVAKIEECFDLIDKL